MNWTPVGKRSIGRPKETWRRMAEKERDAFGWTSWAEAAQRAADRAEWRTIVHALCDTWRPRDPLGAPMEKPSNGDLVSGSETRSDMTRVRETMRRLLEMTDYKTERCQVDLEFILKAIQAETSTSVTAEYKTTDVIIKAGLAQLFGNILSELSEPSGIALQHMRLIAACMCNATNRSEDICKQVVDMALPQRILKYLKNDKLDPTTNPKRMENDDVRICVINMMCVLHNVMKVYDPTNMTGTHGFTTVGLLEGLNKLANNDGNKVRIVRQRALPIYKELLKIGNQKEQLLAVQGIRRLAFRCRDFIIQEPGCVVALKELASSNDKDNDKLKKKAARALWSLEHKHTEKDSTGKNTNRVYASN
ncbi:hypothetical protein LSAT2_020747 [Lamellibrachia satsuma]|nr:hypothetical protein LSAT2_020747 [Lamellibrachia satsuma]